MSADPARDDAAANADELGSVVRTLTHDLAAPLRAIRGFAQLVAEEHGSQLDPEGRRLVELIVSSTAQMRLLIDGLARFGALGELPAYRESIDMQVLVQETVAAERVREPQRDIRVTVHTLPPARGVADSMRNVWEQLIGNAFKFTHSRPAATIEIGHTAGPGSGTYWVRDNGIGFDMRCADRLFGILQRFHSREDFAGAGVGLAIARRILQLHGGRIWAASRPDEGTIFQFMLPD